MAHKLVFAAPYMGMPYMWNISQSVGTQITEVNAPTDVRLAKLLVKCVLETPGAGKSITPSCKVKPVINETMDQCLGFWIYCQQVENQWKADGAMSPSRKYPSEEFMITRMNLHLFKNARSVWESIPTHPECGAMLAAELAIVK